jgi:hypothetical protein
MAAVLVIGSAPASGAGEAERVTSVPSIPTVPPLEWSGRFAKVEDMRAGSLPTSSELAQYVAWLQPGGTLRVRVAGAALTERDASQLLLNGFVQPAVEGPDVLVARKPDWDQAPQKLSFASKTGAAKGAAWRLDDEDLVEEEFKKTAPAPASAAVWKMDLADAELEDENALLADISTVERPSELVTAVGEEDCSTSKKACRNCVCGRGSAEAAQGAVAKQQSLLETGAAVKQGDKLLVGTWALRSSCVLLFCLSVCFVPFVFCHSCVLCVLRLFCEFLLFGGVGMRVCVLCFCSVCVLFCAVWCFVPTSFTSASTFPL